METLSETKMTLTFVFLVSLCTFVFLLTFALLRKQNQYHGDCYGFRYALPVEKWNKLFIKFCQYQKILLDMYIALERVAT